MGGALVRISGAPLCRHRHDSSGVERGRLEYSDLSPLTDADVSPTNRETAILYGVSFAAFAVWGSCASENRLNQE